jgi:WD40 repeat protein
VPLFKSISKLFNKETFLNTANYLLIDIYHRMLEKLDMELIPVLGIYQIEKIITGSVCDVYFTSHPGWKEEVVIKAPNKRLRSDQSLIEQALKGADAWTGLGPHPNIACCYYIRTMHDVPCAIIEYADGGSFRKWTRSSRCCSFKTAIDLAVQFCHGMEHAHSAGVLHLDIRPENILLTRGGCLKITDFGFFRTVDAAEYIPAPGTVSQAKQDKKELSTGIDAYKYMSPQQYEDPCSADARDDIFSFGLCLYEMLCGGWPFKAEYPYKARTGGEEPTDPQDFSPTMRRGLAGLIKKCCMLEREQRPASFKEIRVQLIDIYRGIYKQDPPHAELKSPVHKTGGLNNRGVSCHYLGREAEARKFWEEALREDPLHLGANLNLGCAKWSKGEITSGDILMKMQILEISQKDNPDYWRCMGWIYLEQGDIESIEKIQQSAHRIDDKDFLMALKDPNRPDDKLLRVFDSRFDWINSVAFSSDGRYFLSGGGSSLRMWDIETGKVLQVFQVHSGPVYTTVFSPYGRYVLSGGGSTLHLWDIDMGRKLRLFEGHSGPVYSVAFSRDGSFAISGSADKTLRLWDVESGQEVRSFEGHSGPVYSVAFSRDGSFAISGSADNTLRLWDIDMGKELRVFEGHSGPVYSVAFCCDGLYALSGSEDKTLRQWETESGKELRVYEGHSGPVYSVAFSRDGYYALSGGADKTLRLWDIESGRELRAFKGHSNGVNSVAFNPDGCCALSGSSDRTMRLWKMRYGWLIKPESFLPVIDH